MTTTTATQRIEINRLRNEEWFQFHTEVRELVNTNPGGAAALGIEPLFILYNAKYDEADTALEVLRKSPTTEKITEADHVRDVCYRGFADMISGLSRHIDPAKRDAALRVQNVLTHYGNVTRQTYDSETAALYNFVQEMRGTYQNALELLQLTEWIEQLDQSNRAFETLMQARYKEKDTQTDLRMTAVRVEMDKIFRHMLDQLDINALAGSATETVAVFITTLNNRIARYRDTLSQRSGRKVPLPAASAAAPAAPAA